MRGLLENFFAVSPGFAFVGGSDSAEPALAAAAKGEVDLVVLDLLIRGEGGLLALQRIKDLPRPPSVLVFSATASIHSLRLAVMYGASGYLEKSAPLEEISTALRRIRAGGVHFGERPSQLLTTIMRSSSEASSALARNELRLLELMAAGKCFKTIAHEMSVSPQKVYRVRQSLMRRAGTRSTPDLIRYMVEIGLGKTGSPPV
jgi:two-component system invasion response regulator UvrY